MQQYKYDELTWPEINEAIKAQRIPLLPVGSVEQHGHHLPLSVDWYCAHTVCEEAARRRPDRLLLMPPVYYGHCPHVMDFPGTITTHWRNLINYCLDITKSLAYHGFKKMIIVNGHGSNTHLMDVVSRRTVLETDAMCARIDWWSLLRVDPTFADRWPTQPYPGGYGHADELETAYYLYMDPKAVRKEGIWDSNGKPSPFLEPAPYDNPPVTIPGYHSQGNEYGVGGQPSKATAEKGKLAFDEAVKQLVAFADIFAASPYKARNDHHPTPPTSTRPG